MNNLFPYSIDWTEPVNINFDSTLESLPWLLYASYPTSEELMCCAWYKYTGTHAGVKVELEATVGVMFSASIPDWAEMFTYSGYDPKVLWAALWHDIAYRNNKYPREVCDAMYNDLCRACKTQKTERTFMRKALNWFGGSSYNKRK